MKVQNKYISTSENAKKEDKTKKVLSDEAYAICEFLEDLKVSFDAMRLHR